MELSKLSDAELDALYMRARMEKAGIRPDEYKPTDGPWYENFLAGAGKAFMDTGRGAGNLVTDAAPGAAKLGFSTRANTDETKKYDAPLMESGAGVAGNVVGNLAPAVLLPGSTIPRALATGLALGATQPVGTGDSRMANMATSGAFAAAAPAAIGAYRTGRALVEPIMAPQRTAARVLEQFADDPAAMRAAAQSATEIIPGSKPTLAQAAMQPGISSLERGAMNQPGPLQAGLSARAAEQNAARMAALGGVAKDDSALQAAIAARQAAAGPAYEAAKGVMIEADDSLKSVLSRPSMKSAWERATRLAKENGETLTVGIDAPATKVTTGILDSAGNEIAHEVAATSKSYSGRGLHYLKLALDDMIDSGAASGIGKNEQRALMGTKEKLLGWMDQNIPEYAQARKAYASGSQPINEMQFGQELERRITPALSDVAGGPPSRLLPERFAQALRDSESTIRRSTGKDLNIDQVLSPDAKGKVFGVAQDLDRASRAAGLGKPAGSPTAQFLTTQNLMRNVMGPLGLPGSFADKSASALMTTPYVGNLLQFGTKAAEGRVQQELAQMLLDPKTAAQAMAIINKQPGRFGKGMQQMLPYMPAASAGLGASGMFSYLSQQ